MPELTYDLTQTPDLWYLRSLSLDPAYVNQRIAWFLAEDMPLGDITVESTIDAETLSVAHVLAAQSMVFAGASILPLFFSEDTSLEPQVSHGEAVVPGTVLAVL